MLEISSWLRGVVCRESPRRREYTSSLLHLLPTQPRNYDRGISRCSCVYNRMLVSWLLVCQTQRQDISETRTMVMMLDTDVVSYSDLLNLMSCTVENAIVVCRMSDHLQGLQVIISGLEDETRRSVSRCCCYVGVALERMHNVCTTSRCNVTTDGAREALRS